MTFIQYIFTKSFIKQLLYAIVALIIIVFLTMWWLRISTNHNQKIEVPNLSKLSLDAVENKLNELDLRYEILDSANYNPEYPKYSVIEQIPKAGNFVKEDRKIYLTLNPKEYKKLKIPNVVGRTRRQAEPTLIAMGFKIGKITHIPYIAKDEVLQLRYKGKKLKKGDFLKKTSTIDLVLGDGNGGLNSNSENKNNDSEGK